MKFLLKIFTLISLLIIILIGNFYLNNKKNLILQHNRILKHSTINSLKKQNNISEIIGLVFYGRRNSVKILLRYLDINLRKNGGILDKVIFAIHTNVKEDLDYIETFVGKNNQYYKMNRYRLEGGHVSSYFKELYSACNNNDIVFKIDDDILFIANGTFELMLTEYLKRKDFILSANVINHCQLYIHELTFMLVKELFYRFMKLNPING